ncbi:hypothetical protein [Flavimaribacter sediminis]|nr:hypothetical protein [Flavimaribacter sediminis]
MMGMLPDEWWHRTLLWLFAASAASMVLIIGAFALVAWLVWG